MEYMRVNPELHIEEIECITLGERGKILLNIEIIQQNNDDNIKLVFLFNSKKAFTYCSKIEDNPARSMEQLPTISSMRCDVKSKECGVNLKECAKDWQCYVKSLNILALGN